MRQLKYYQAILEATDYLLESDPSVYIMGLGVPDPKGIFGTTSGLLEKYGEKRVLDMPTAENGMTGIAIGSSLVGMRPIMTHQRVDFFLLALDQLINNASKWREMFDGKMEVPLVIRLIVGRGWGQGPQHSQSLHALFAHIPGLKVVAPATPYDAKGLLIAASKENDPVIYLEHRWLHNIFGEVPRSPYVVPIGKAKVMQDGQDVTLIASSEMTLVSYRAAKFLEKEGISCEVLDLRTIKPLDHDAILESVKKTGRVIAIDGDFKTCGLASEVITLIAEEGISLKAPPKRITFPDRYCPTSWALSNHYYPHAEEIAVHVLEMFGEKVKAKETLKALIERHKKLPHDVPDPEFTGPF